ncbi:hypothetical protein SETIT_1G186700v2 [Setaria italica]|uniref:Complex III subunit VI n=1 Tax=Setaria italica TaxID=4555 RepID=K3YWG4_SETIT|nr:hypothetical protein SETIT_1G186700v2 [Setaria italica]
MQPTRPRVSTLAHLTLRGPAQETASSPTHIPWVRKLLLPFLPSSHLPHSPTAPLRPRRSPLAPLDQGFFLCSPEFVAPMADEEVSDPKALLEDRTKAKCVSQWYEYQKCVKRIENDETGQKHCTGQYFDYWKCVDKNVAEKLFELLK